MKKLLKKRVLIPLAVVAVVAIGAAVAYAMFSGTASTTPTNVTSATAALGISESGWSGTGLSGLLPGGPATTDVVTVTNNGTTPFSATTVTCNLANDFAGLTTGTMYSKELTLDIYTSLPYTTNNADNVYEGNVYDFMNSYSAAGYPLLWNAGSSSALKGGESETVAIVVSLNASAGNEFAFNNWPAAAQAKYPQLQFTVTGNQ